MRLIRSVGPFVSFILMVSSLVAEIPNAGEVEAARCEEKIASVRREVLNRYDDALNELQLTFQKAADLDGALAVRNERNRAAKDQDLSEKNLVDEPKNLRALQQQSIAKIHELVTQLVQDALPKLIEQKKALTIAGKLDEAVSVRSAIERLQNANVPLSRPDPNSAVLADTLVLAYSADRSRADKQYRSQKMTVRGVVGGYRQNPNDSTQYHIYLASSSGGWVQCTFSTGDFRFREDNQFNAATLVVTPKSAEGNVVRVQKGQPIEIRGVCEGWEDLVKMNKCDFAR